MNNLSILLYLAKALEAWLDKQIDEQTNRLVLLGLTGFCPHSFQRDCLRNCRIRDGRGSPQLRCRDSRNQGSKHRVDFQHAVCYQHLFRLGHSRGRRSDGRGDALRERLEDLASLADEAWLDKQIDEQTKEPTSE